MEPYEAPILIATYSIEEVLAEAASSIVSKPPV